MDQPRGSVNHVIGSASIWVLGQVAGSARTAPVIHASPEGVFVDLEGNCLGVLAGRGVQVPCGIRTSLTHLPPVEEGSDVVVHDGAVELPGAEVLVTNIVDTTVPVLNEETAAWGRTTIEESAGRRLKPLQDELPSAPLAALSEADPSAATGLLGVGEGPVPVGDEVLCGWLATAVASRHPGLPEVRSGVALTATERTSKLSATLLACAARGEGVPEFHSLLSGVSAKNTDVVDQSLDLLFSLDHGKGAGLLLGLLLALQSPSLVSSAPLN